MKINPFWKKLREYFGIYLPVQKNSSEKTVISCRMAWNILLRFLLQEKGIPASRLEFESFTAALVEEFLDTVGTRKGWKAATRNNRLSCIRSFFKFAAYTVPEACMAYDDLRAIPLKKGTDNSRVVNHMPRDAVTAVIRCIDADTPRGLRDRFFLTLMYDTAARSGEMLSLRLSDINTDTMTACLFGKGAKPRLVPVSRETMQLFRRYKILFHKDSAKDCTLFYTRHRNEKTPMSDDNVARFLKKYADEARRHNNHVPENIHPHMLRHSRAMHLYQNGMPLAMLSEFLGHENPETTLIYAHADTEMKRQAIEKASRDLLTADAVEDVPTWESGDIIARLLKGY